MKKFGLIFVGLMLVLAGCSEKPAKPSNQSESSSETTSTGAPVSDVIEWKSVNRRPSSDIAIAIDKETGCEYIELDNVTVTPRLNHNGQPMCN